MIFCLILFVYCLNLSKLDYQAIFSHEWAIILLQTSDILHPMNKLIRPIVDVVMIIILIALMAHTYLPGSFHEAVGLCLLAVVGGHLWLSLRKFAGVRRSTFSWFRTACRLAEIFLLINLILLTVTGISLAHTLFILTTPPLRPSLARPLHRILSHTLLLLVGIHTGLRLPGFLSIVGFRQKKSNGNPVKRFILNLCGGITAVYGLTAAIRRNYFNIDLNSNLMAFSNSEAPFAFFLFDLMTILILAIITGMILRRLSRKASNTIHETKDTPL